MGDFWLEAVESQLNHPAGALAKHTGERAERKMVKVHSPAENLGKKHDVSHDFWWCLQCFFFFWVGEW